MRKIIIFLLLFLSCLLYSQTKVSQLIDDLYQLKEDSLKVNHYYTIAENYLKIDSTKSIFYTKKGLELAKKINWGDGITYADVLRGKSFADNNNYVKSLELYNQAIKKTNSKSIQAKAYFYIGENYLQENKYAIALNSFHKSLKLYELVKDKSGITKVLVSIGSLYTGFGKNKEALESYNKALKLSQQNNNLNQELALRGIATVYYNTSDYEKSLDYFEKSLAIIQKGNDKILESRLLSDIALVYLELGTFQKAIDYSQASLKTDRSVMNNIHNVAFSYGVIGDSYVELAREKNRNPKLIDSAITYLEKAVASHKRFKSLRGLHDDYRSISEAHKLKKNYSKALETYEISMTYKDSMYNSDNKETIKNLEDKREIELRDREIKINNLKLEAKEKQKWFLISGLAFLGIIGSLFFYQSTNRKKINQKLQLLNSELDEANKAKTRFFSILNHDLRGPVANLVFFLQLQKESPELLDEESIKRMQDKTMSGAENLLASMEDILQWSKSQMENFKPQPAIVKINTIFEDTKTHFSSEEKVKIIFENLNNIQITTDENYLKTVIRNLTGNAIKALKDIQNPTVIWKAWEEKGQSYLSISDNGKGASQEQFKALYDDKEVVGIKTGLGLHLIRDLAKAIDCVIKVDSKINEGTTITLIL